MICDLAYALEIQANVIRSMAARLEELGEISGFSDEIAEADKLYCKAMGGG